MCGIFATTILNKSLIKLALDSIRKRGPDSEQTQTTHGVCLGHSRLSILDLSSGANQPLTYKHCIIVFNGEIYNFAQIRKQLIDLGYSFRTTGDTEVICAAYLEWGTECLEKFNGMFAFCLHDTKKELLFVARDRFGVKPLYYSVTENNFVCASQFETVAYFCPKKTLSRNALIQYFHLRYTCKKTTMFEEISRLEPGHFFVYQLKKKKIIQYVQWYNLLNRLHKAQLTSLAQNEKIPTYAQAKKKVKHLLEQAVALRMVSDVPVASFLSGGLDSSLLCALAKKHNSALHTFSIGFETTNELPFAKTVADSLHTRHFAYETNHEKLKESIRNLITHIDEPIASPGFLPILYLSEQVAQHNKVVLSGDGADEIFCGYDRYKLLHYSQFLPQIPSLIATTHEIAQVFHAVKEEKKHSEKYFVASGLFTKKELLKLGMKYHAFEQFFSWPNMSTTFVNKCMILDVMSLMPYDFFMKADKMSSAYGLEQREPYMDYQLVEYVLSLPISYRLRFGKEKRILKDIAKQYIPQSITNRKKSGFNVPIDLWFKNELGTELERLLDKRDKENDRLKTCEKAILSERVKTCETKREISKNIIQKDTTKKNLIKKNKTQKDMNYQSLSSQIPLYQTTYIRHLLEKLRKKGTNYKENFIIAQKLWAIYILEKWLERVEATHQMRVGVRK